MRIAVIRGFPPRTACSSTMFGSRSAYGYTSCILLGSSLYFDRVTISSASRNGRCTR